MQKLFIFTFGAVTLLGCNPQKVQKPFETSPLHEPKLVMNREYWTFLGSSPITDPGYGAGEKAWRNPWNNPAFTNLPAFRDCGLVRSANKPPSSDKNCTSASWSTVAESCGPMGMASVMDTTVTNRPMVLVFGGKRNVLAMAGDINLDYADWAAYKKAHPNLICTRTMCEWGNDMLLNKSRTDQQVHNPARREELHKVWNSHKMDDRYQRLALCRWYTDRKLKLHYDDMDTFMAFRGMFHLDHVAAAWGAKYLVHEQTNTTGGNSEYRWDISGMFCRGAARQFGLPWAWYEAAYFNGPAQDGSQHNDSVPRYKVSSREQPRPQDGTSASAQRRMWYYAYVNGANAVESESWSGCFFTTNTPTGKAWLSPRGKNFVEFHDFAMSHANRGVTYAPVAILTPFAQGYVSQGGRAWASCPYTSGDYALDAIFFTIAPGWERAKSLKKGIQDGNLHNSKFAMMYDVLVPDSPQPKEAFAKALFAYPAAILAGDYKDESQFADVLAAYEKAGGKLIRVTAADLPPLAKKPHETIDQIRSGRLTFPKVEAKLAALQNELFPFSVSGDCQFGANKTKNGWWLWVFNNRGVCKYADTFEKIDHTKDTTITVTMRKGVAGPVTELLSGAGMTVSGDAFTYKLPAGELAIFEIGPDAEFAAPRAVFAKYYNAVTGKIVPADAVTFALDKSIAANGKDTYTIKSSGAGVRITGSNVRSLYYGVYDLLERRGGCHWFWDGDVVPRQAGIDLSGLDITESANFEYRGLRYFAHRGLTRFQAEHWGLEDWKKEIDWCLKRRLNMFMLRIGQDDLFQRTFPDIVSYPDPAVELPGHGKGYDNRSLFWSLPYRGQLRADVQKYARDRGLMVPEDFGTMTHWYSRTPEDYLEKMKPPFLPQSTSGYSEKNGLVWDIRDPKWVEEYWKLTKTAVDIYGGGKPELLHTPGLGERRCYTNRADNLALKIKALDIFLSRAHREYPDAKVMLAGWDFYFTWHPDEVKELVSRLDPKHDIIWDYEGDATRDFRPEMMGLKNDFTKWGVVGKFPYTYSVFLAFEDALDMRANYPLIEERQKIVQNDPACAGYIFWPESSHTDTLLLRHFTANAWSKDAVKIDAVLDEFCASRYGADAALWKKSWEKAIPVSRLLDWSGNYCKYAVLRCKFRVEPSDPKTDPEYWAYKAKQHAPAVAALDAILTPLLSTKFENEFEQRDALDLARMAFDRRIIAENVRMMDAFFRWKAGKADAQEVVGHAERYAKMGEMMARLLALHTDYSIWESFERLDAIEKVRNPNFPQVLLDNATCLYCASHHYESAEYWYKPVMRNTADALIAAVKAGDRKAKAPTDAFYAKKHKEFLGQSLKAMRPTLPRTRENFQKVLREFMEVSK